MQSIFKRYEEKYLIPQELYAELQKIMSLHMESDQFGEYLVQNLYYDTENWDIIRASIERPLYKEKMRLRCYGIPDKDSRTYLELKKKYEGIVHKRRVAIPFSDLSISSAREVVASGICQISNELDFYIEANAVSEKVYIAYHRTAFIGTENKGLRVTFDKDVRFRLDCLDYFHPDDGCVILPQDKVLMEVKTFGGMPMWLARALSENGIFPTKFSKYGVCYTDYIFKKFERKVLVCA